LRLKIMVISNEVPNLNDANGVLPSRFVKLRFGVSFYGREDVDLRGKLEKELPGIAARCVRAYQRLCARGKFVQPAAADALKKAVIAKSDPFAAMLQECFDVAAGALVEKQAAYSRFVRWCGENGRSDLRMSVTSANFTTRLAFLVPKFNRVPPAWPTAPIRRTSLTVIPSDPPGTSKSPWLRDLWNRRW
jgi:putative DNA primase/helicase